MNRLIEELEREADRCGGLETGYRLTGESVLASAAARASVMARSAAGALRDLDVAMKAAS